MMTAVFAAMSLALVIGWFGRRSLANVCLVVCLVLAVPVVAYFTYVDPHRLSETALDYVSFIILLASLYVISGGPSEGGSTSTVNQVFFFRLACSVNADCNDGNTCTTDICVTGTCQRTNNTAPCNDGVACTADSCNEATDSCDYVPGNALCDDGLYCNGAETCTATGCAAGAPVA